MSDTSGLITNFTGAQNGIIKVGGIQYVNYVAVQPYALTKVDDYTLRFEVRQGDKWNYDGGGIDRAEVSGAYPDGRIADNTPYAVAYRVLVEPGGANTASWFVTSEWHNSDDDLPDDSWYTSPPWAIEVQGEKWTVKHMTCPAGLDPRPGGPNVQVSRPWTSANNFIRDQWYLFEIEAKTSLSNGYLRVKCDGVQVVNYTGPLGYGCAGYLLYGLYRETNATTFAMKFKNMSTSWDNEGPMAITFSINGGVDAAKFTIDATTGALAFVSAPNFEAPTDANGDNIYEVTIRATDSDGLFDAKTILVTVTNVAEGGALPPLTNSGNITVTANNQIIENKNITGRITVPPTFSGVIIRNCIVRHAAGVGILTQNTTNLTIQDVEIINTSAPAGQTPVPGEVKNMEIHRPAGTTLLERIKIHDGCGLYCYQATGTVTVKYFEGHNVRGLLNSPYRGCLFQFNACSATMLVEDFSCECDVNDSWPEDFCSVHYCTGQFTARRGFLKGASSPTGVMFMVEQTNGAIVEDVDYENHFNGGLSVYDNSASVTYRRCRGKNQFLTNQGRGNPTSSYCNFVSAPGCTGTRFEQIKYFNVSTNLAWDLVNGGFAVKDWVSENFTSRAPIRNRTPGT